jgi:hypothetical protein
MIVAEIIVVFMMLWTASFIGYNLGYNRAVKDGSKSGAEAAEFLKQIKSEETCVSCGETIPEGRQVCPGCEGGGKT